MKLRFVTDHISSSGVIRRAGDVREYPDGMADILIRRGKAEAYREPQLNTYRPKKQKAADE